MPANVTGASSVFPAALDNFGSEFTDDSCQIVDAGAYNLIQDALFNLENHTHRVLQSGEAGVYTPAISGSLRPALLLKAYTVTATGATAVTQTFALSGFTAAEQSMFGGAPLASGNLIHTQIRKAAGDAYRQRAYHCAVQGPIVDPTGNSGWTVVGANLQHGNGQTTIDGGGTVYVISVMITTPF